MSVESANVLDHYPAGTPPSGVTPNFVSPPSRATEIKILDSVFTGVMFVAVFARFFVRAKFTKTWGWDDVACAMAALGSLAHLVMYTQMIRFVGFGRHMWDIPASWVLDRRNGQLLSSNGIIYPFTILFTKVSILLLYVRMFNTSRRFTVHVSVGAGIMALFYTSMIGIGIGSILECHGLAASTLQFCKNYSGPVVLLNGVFNVVTDFWILALPFPFITKLQIRFRQKLGLAVTFAAALAACASSLARITEFAINYSNPDVLGVQALNAEFTIIKINIGIVVACVTSFPILFKQTKLYLQSKASSLRNLRRLRISSLKKSSTGFSEVGGSANLPLEPAKLEDMDPYIELQTRTTYCPAEAPP